MAAPRTLATPGTGLDPQAYRELMGASPLPLAVVGHTGQLLEANRAFAALVDTSMGRLRQRALRDLTDPADRAALDHALADLLGSGGARARTVSLRLLDGSDRPVPVTAHLSVAGSAATAHLLLAAVDDRAAPLGPQAIEHAATHDPLTGLLNRAGLIEQLQRLLADGRRASLAMLDLDTLGPVDDAYGPGGGDHLLRRVAAALTDLTTPDGLAGRLAGDEFVVIADTDDDESLGRFLTDQLAQVRIEVAPGVVLAATPSVGTSPVEPGLTPSQILARADETMYAVKQRRQDALSRA